VRSALTSAANSVLATVTVALVTSISQAGVVEVRHDPLECVHLSTYARLSARALPEAQVARVEVQFRVDPTAGWYSLLMVRDDGGGWSGRLPRPISPLERFEYRIVVTASDLGVVETPVVGVRVSPPGAPCEKASTPSTADETPIAVRVPAGSPLMPPVPPGFSPAGVVAILDPVRERGRIARLGTLGAIAAGTAAGIAVVTAPTSLAPDPGPPPLTPPQFSIFAVDPPSNSALSLSSGRVVFNVRVTGAVGVPLSFTWRLEFWRNVNSCLTMAGEATVGPTRPENVILTGPFVPTGACGSRFDVDANTLTLLIDGQIVFERRLNLLFHVEP